MDDIKSLLLPATAHFNRQYQHQKIGGALESAKNRAADKADPKLRAACNEMESLFINYLFKEMRATIDKSGFISGGQAEEIFTSLLDVELSRKISGAGGIGLSAILLEQLGGQENRQGVPESQPGLSNGNKIKSISDQDQAQN
jgi:flagellar protein FlgJ